MNTGDQEKHIMKNLEENYLKPFLNRSTQMNAKKTFLAFYEKNVPIPDDIIGFFAASFKKEIARYKKKSEPEDPDNDRPILVELMIRIAQSKESESISSICQKVAEESGIVGDENNTAGEVLHKRMKSFQKRSRVRKG